jgi:hypothetical protein
LTVISWNERNLVIIGIRDLFGFSDILGFKLQLAGSKRILERCLRRFKKLQGPKRGLIGRFKARCKPETLRQILLPKPLLVKSQKFSELQKNESSFS